MSRRKLLLINPVNPHRAGLAVSLSSRFPPLGLGVLAALTPDGWEVALIDENFKPFKYQEADLVGLTAFTAAAPRAYHCVLFCQRLQRRNICSLKLSSFKSFRSVLDIHDNSWGWFVAWYHFGNVYHCQSKD